MGESDRDAGSQRPSRRSSAPDRGARAPAATTPRKRISLALQGGGAHGAFTWGVLDRLLADGRLEVAGVCGTSAGAVNAAVVTYGLHVGGRDGARGALTGFWQAIAAAAAWSPLRPTPLDRLASPGNMDSSPAWLLYDALSRVFSPYQLNPMNLNRLRDLLVEAVDFAALRACTNPKLFLCATNVLTGKLRVFETHEVTPEAVLASTCLPLLFQAVEIDGEYFWDGGYMGNPPIFPLIYNTDCRDVVIIQINPIAIPEVPRTARAILDRINTLSFNSSLMREMRAIHFVTRLVEQGLLPQESYKRMNIHMIGAEAEMTRLGASSKLNADREFLAYLRDLGRAKAQTWLDAHFDKVGRESSVDLATVFL